MEKKRILIIPTLLMAMNFISAASFSLDSFLRNFDASTIILINLFIIFFALLFFVLDRAFRGNKSIAGIIAFCLSLLIIYGINNMGWDYQGIVYDMFGSIGISEDFLFFILPLIFIFLSIVIMIKLGFGALLIILGVLFVVLSIFNFFEDPVLGWTLGMLFLFFGWLIWRRRKKKQEIGYSGSSSTGESYLDRRRQRLNEKNQRKLAEEQLRQQKFDRIRAEKEQTQRVKEKKDLQTQYDKYSARVQKIMKRWNGKIPAENSQNSNERADSAEYSRHIRAMRRLEKIARKNNIQLG